MNSFVDRMQRLLLKLLFRKRYINGWFFDPTNPGYEVYSKGDVRMIIHGGPTISDTIDYHLGNKMTEIYIEMGHPGMLIWPERITTWKYEDGHSQAITKEEFKEIVQNVTEVYGPLNVGETII